MKVEILDEAQEDLLDGYRFYECQSGGLGDYFLDSLFSDIDSLQIYAGIHSVHFGYHRFLSKRFPFAIYYRVVRIVLTTQKEPTLIKQKGPPMFSGSRTCGKCGKASGFSKLR
ncbi:MAG: type II toxin-antitoxin system RelE/ParE family toxin [candidate division NC10 bacterium]|nr:type II toxin-antitoxin system RelE/ParE family toxin [candidate division NC10 bacterium]MDE2321061.1 type II toxin-antitoxin system RelE/ParE family toxin [candidate division NC10 bacterium]